MYSYIQQIIIECLLCAWHTKDEPGVADNSEKKRTLFCTHRADMVANLIYIYSCSLLFLCVSEVHNEIDGSDDNIH